MHFFLISVFALTVSVIFPSLPAFANPSDPSIEIKTNEVTIDGRVDLGIEKSQGEDVSTDFGGRLQATSKRHEGFQATLEMEADQTSRQVSIDDAYVDYQDPDNHNRLRFGRGKKMLGWEYEYPTAAQISLSRSAPYDYLGERGIVTRDYFVSYAWIIPSGDGDVSTARDLKSISDTSYYDPSALIDPSELWKFEVSAHLDEQDDVSLVASVIRNFGANWRLGAWALFERDQSVSQVYGVWAGTLSGLYQNGIHRAELEIFAGTDPYRSEINALYSDGRAIQFAAIRAEYGLFLAKWNPYILGDILWKDWSDKANHAYEGTAGLRYFFIREFSVAGEGYLVANFATSDASEVSDHDNGFRVVGRYYF